MTYSKKINCCIQWKLESLDKMSDKWFNDMTVEYVTNPGEYLLSQHELYHIADDAGLRDTCLRIVKRTDKFIDALIRSDEYHKMRNGEEG